MDFLCISVNDSIMAPLFNRKHPSEKYNKLIKLHQIMHQSSKLYTGLNLIYVVDMIKWLLKITQSKTLLDYGAGKGQLYELKQFGPNKDQDLKTYWNIDDYYLYDPAYEPLAKLPDHTFDAVICVDVLEHCSALDIPWILEEIFFYARKLVFLAIACYPASKKLPDNKNAHNTVQPPEWWQLQISQARGKKDIYCLAQFELGHPQDQPNVIQILWKDSAHKTKQD